MTKWSGRNVAILATGPSLTAEDCEAVRAAGCITVGVNSAWMTAPWIDVLYAGDNRYWKANIKAIDAAGITAKRYSRSSKAEKAVEARYVKTRLGQDYNSGQMAIELAIRRDADLVILLGFDCSIKHGIHCHGPHVDTPNPNEVRCNRWKEQFARIPRVYPKANVVNCSRYTEIDCFPKRSLEEVLCGLS